MDRKLSHFCLFFYLDLPGPISGSGLIWRELMRPGCYRSPARDSYPYGARSAVFSVARFDFLKGEQTSATVKLHEHENERYFALAVVFYPWNTERRKTPP